jgi:sarcosine oxidase
MSLPPPASAAADVPSTYDVIVVGLGGLGAATTCQLARAGQRVLGIEQFELGHDRGASHDTSRILRHSYHRPDYVRLTKQAYADWTALEEASGQQLVTTTGGLDLCPADSTLTLDDYADSLAEGTIPFERLDAKEIHARWPQISVDESTAGLYQARTGMVPAGQTTATLQRLAASAGAKLVDRTPVTEVREHGNSVTVVTPDREFTAAAVVVCADAWAPRLVAPLGWDLQLTVLDQQVTYFEPSHPAAFATDRFPVWIWVDDPCFYGFPCYGEPTVKAGEDCGGPVVDPDNRAPGTDHDALRRLSQFMSRTFPASGRSIRSVRCLYTLTPDRDFALGAVPGTERVYVALGAAHAFKFVPTIGRLMATMVLGQHDPDAEWVHAFTPDRPALTDPDYAPAWMV